MKKLIASALATSMLLGITAVAPFTANASENLKRNDTHEYTPTTNDTNRYYFMMPSDWINEYSETCGIYWWTGTDPADPWPGYEAKQSDVPNVYYMDVPKDVTAIIWNNAIDGGEDPEGDIYTKAYQTTDIGTEYYDEGECELYPEGTESFDNMIYVLDNSAEMTRCVDSMTKEGEWYYYYGNGEYGLAPLKEDAEEIFTSEYQDVNALIKKIQLKTKLNDTVEYIPTTEDTNRYYFRMPEEWTNKYAGYCGVYWWTGTDIPESWPGYQAKQSDVPNVYYLDIPKDVKEIRWNNAIDGGEYCESELYNSSCQTVNINTECYDADESEVYPEGLESFDNMIYVLDKSDKILFEGESNRYEYHGEWYFYYGNGEYGIDPTIEEAKFITKSEFLSIERVLSIIEEYNKEHEDHNKEHEDHKQNHTQEYVPTAEDTNRYYFMMPSDWINDYAETCGIYWEDETAVWPGYQAQQGDLPNIYYMDVPKSVTDINWNNALDGKKEGIFWKAFSTDAIDCTGYEAGENVLYPDGLNSFDNMIYIIDYAQGSGGLTYTGEWYYYYGNGEYGTAPTKEDADEVYSSESLSVISIMKQIMGDIDGNGRVDVNDVTQLQYYLADLTKLNNVQTILARTTGYSRITVNDVTAIQKYIADMIPSLAEPKIDHRYQMVDVSNT